MEINRIYQKQQQREPKLNKQPKKISIKITNREIHRQECLRKKRETARAARQKVKEDRDKYEIYRQKERERYKKKKVEGKIKSADELTAKEREKRRKKQNEWKKNSRLKQRIEGTSSRIECERSSHVMSKQAKVSSNITILLD